MMDEMDQDGKCAEWDALVVESRELPIRLERYNKERAVNELEARILNERRDVLMADARNFFARLQAVFPMDKLN